MMDKVQQSKDTHIKSVMTYCSTGSQISPLGREHVSPEQNVAEYH